MHNSLSTLQPLHRQLRDARRRAGLTQVALAAQAGCMQSAVSMMEGGRMAALSRSTLEKIAEILGVQLPAEHPAAPVAAATVPGAEKLCPSADCPSNLPYLVGDELFFLPRGTVGDGRHCPLCGEVLVVECGSCGSRILPFAACCGQCGGPLVAPPTQPVADLRAWVSERQQQAQLLASWTTASARSAP